MRGAVLVTGGTGFVGRAVIRRLREQGRHVVATTTGAIDAPGLDPNVQWVHWDATGRELPTVDFMSLDAVAHLAVPRALFDFPASAGAIYQVVVDATFALLEASRSAGVRRFILASTGDVLGSRPEPARESDRCYEPASFYGASKAAAEMLALSWRELLSVAVVRLYHPYGSGGERFLINRLVQRVMNGQEVTIEGEEGILLNPVWIEDCARGLAAAIESDAEGIFHLAGPDLVTLRAMLELAGELTGVPARIRSLEIVPNQQHAGDDTRARGLLGYHPQVSLEDGLRRVIADFGAEGTGAPAIPTGVVE